MELTDDILALIDYIIQTQKRRHIIGGMLLSISALFACLSFTILTTKEEGKNDE